ncbi:hypothetical protein BOTBODRAFT_498302 [Botryobasidium botryosum FD-172 SS1]|uniref:Uncharacterized protein n=1 Tax=Botryobasidium botryosum (strain FD-172 SS1) TaxID=930990 RepID=A0A067M3L2_BOTB1|nr:hypothetical protein BOTBODRAFT_498302 [Botryobasidium botryosum FD-172 SS1]
MTPYTLGYRWQSSLSSQVCVFLDNVTLSTAMPDRAAYRLAHAWSGAVCGIRDGLGWAHGLPHRHLVRVGLGDRWAVLMFVPTMPDSPPSIIGPCTGSISTLCHLRSAEAVLLGRDRRCRTLSADYHRAYLGLFVFPNIAPGQYSGSTICTAMLCTHMCALLGGACPFTQAETFFLRSEPS